MSPCGRKKDFSSSYGLLLAEDAARTVVLKPDNNVFIGKMQIQEVAKGRD